MNVYRCIIDYNRIWTYAQQRFRDWGRYPSFCSCGHNFFNLVPCSCSFYWLNCSLPKAIIEPDTVTEVCALSELLYSRLIYCLRNFPFTYLTLLWFHVTFHVTYDTHDTLLALAKEVL